MGRIFIVLTFLVCSNSLLNGQESLDYYVSSETLNMREGAGLEFKAIQSLKQYDNVKVIDTSNQEWFKVSFNGKVGYVSKKYIKRGIAKVSSYTVRTGAKCKDGTSSKATGRGACSHHGGVAYWITETKQTVEIIGGES